MASIFSRIIAGELPGRFVYRSDDVVAFLTIAPIRPGHTLVVPVREVDDWLDLTPAELARVAEVSQLVGQAVARAFQPRRVALLVVGLEVPHVHAHLVPIDAESQLSFAYADSSVPAASLDAAAERIRAALAAP